MCLVALLWHTSADKIATMKKRSRIGWLDRWGKPTWPFDACVVHVSSSNHACIFVYGSVSTKCYNGVVVVIAYTDIITRAYTKLNIPTPIH